MLVTSWLKRRQIKNVYAAFIVLIGLGGSAMAGPLCDQSFVCGCAPDPSCVCPEDPCCGLDECCDLDSCTGLGCAPSSCLSTLFTAGGLFQGTTPCFDGFISPISNPVFFEDPRTVSELRPIFIHHEVPKAAGGGHVNLIAVQIRAAITDRLSLIATKDGYATSTNPLIDDGWGDLSLGLKYGLIQDAANQRLLSAGLTFELPTGSTQTLQGNGDGEFNLFVTGGTEFLDRWHFMSATGFRLPVDTSAENQIWYWSNHVDRQFGDKLYGLIETNWYHYMSNGNAGVPGVGGGDLFNLGSPGIAGDDLVTLAFGLKYKPTTMTELGVAYEIPISDREDVIRNRTTVDFIYRF